MDLGRLNIQPIFSVSMEENIFNCIHLVYLKQKYQNRITISQMVHSSSFTNMPMVNSSDMQLFLQQKHILLLSDLLNKQRRNSRGITAQFNGYNHCHTDCTWELTRCQSQIPLPAGPVIAYYNTFLISSPFIGLSFLRESSKNLFME